MARRVRIGRVEDFPAGVITEVEVEGAKVIVVQDAEGLCAAHNKCPHLGLSLTSGPGGRKYADGVIQCPWHNSRFVVRSGENLDWAPGCRRPIDALMVAQAASPPGASRRR